MTGPAQPVLTFWPQGIVQRPFEAHPRAAQAGGFTGLAIAASTYRRLRAEGWSDNDLLRAAEDRGVGHFVIDGIANWVPNWAPALGEAKVNDRLRAQYDVPLEQILDMGAALGARAMCVAGFFDEGSIELDELVEHFARLCDRAAPYGISVDLEFIPIWGLRQLSLAWEIVRRAERQNSGVLVDTWHLQMGSSDLERDLALLETIPGRHLTNVQIVDAPLPRRAATIAREAWYRAFPGEGDLALDRMLSIIAGKGGLRYAGPEPFGAELVDMDDAELGRRSAVTTRQVLMAALPC